MDVGDAGGGASASVWVIGYREETYTLIEVALGNDFVIEVGNDGNVQGRGAAAHPVFAELVTVTGVDWLDGVAEFVENAGEGGEGPAGATLGLPAGTVVFERAE